ncbi:MAG: hypothetical protein AAFU85_15525 [Planctomycetota bacterium]
MSGHVSKHLDCAVPEEDAWITRYISYASVPSGSVKITVADTSD